MYLHKKQKQEDIHETDHLSMNDYSVLNALPHMMLSDGKGNTSYMAKLCKN